MMYQSKLVASLKANNKILREFKDTVYVPFESEYSILIKNLNTVRAVVNVFIDGENQTPGGLVVDVGREVELERSIKNGNLTEGNRFKFIERTGAAEQHRGVKLEDGIVRIEYQFEQRQVFAVGSTNHYINNLSSYPGTTDKFTLTASGSTTVTNISQMNVGGALRGIDLSANGSAMAQAASASVSKYCADNGVNSFTGEVHEGCATMDMFNDAGITVPGSRSTQKFSTTYMGPLEAEKHTIVLKLLGETPDNKPVLKPVTVKHKPKCTTCGKQNRAHAKFCTECGTALEIFA
jgi:hypothetical protein